jgi:hypothetical protein
MKSSVAVMMLLAAPAAAEPKLAGNVLVWIDAPLRLDATEDSASIHLGQLEHGRDHAANYVVPMHVLGELGDFVEVEPTSDIECTWSKVVRPTELASLHLYVKRGDLAPVVTKSFVATFKDGTRIALEPGTAVQNGEVAFNEQVVSVDVPNLGLAYTPHAIAAVPKPGKHTAFLDEHTEVTLGPKSFTFGSWVSPSATQHSDRTLFPIAVRCATATLSVPTDHVQRDIRVGKQAIGGGRPTLGGSTRTRRYYLSKGQKLTPETGDHVVATLAADLDVEQPTGARACADFEVTRDEPMPEAPHPDEASIPNRRLHLCAPASDVKRF